MTKVASGSARPPRVARTSARRPRPALPVGSLIQGAFRAPASSTANLRAELGPRGVRLVPVNLGAFAHIERPRHGHEPTRRNRRLETDLVATPGHRPRAPDHVLRRSELDTPVQRAGLAARRSRVDFRAPMGTGASAREVTTWIRPMRESREPLSGRSKLARLGAIAQLGERLVRNQEVAGSSPASSIEESPANGGGFFAVPITLLECRACSPSSPGRSWICIRGACQGHIFEELGTEAWRGGHIGDIIDLSWGSGRDIRGWWASQSRARR